MTDEIQTLFPDPIDGSPREAVWRDKGGILHRAIGAEVHPGTRLMWTACGKYDIPANQAWLAVWGDKGPTCAECKSWRPE